jgi:2-aminoadipate transaminase
MASIPVFSPSVTRDATRDSASGVPLQGALAGWLAGRSRSMLREMVALAARPGVLSLAGGLPDPALFPCAEYAAAVRDVLEQDSRALQYQPAFEPLKAHIVELMAQRGVVCGPESVFVVTGAQQGLDLCVRALVEPGEPVVHENLTYPGMQQALAAVAPRVVTVTSDRHSGFDVDELAAHLARGLRPRLIYVMPDAHNPLGVSLSQEKRHALVDLARRYEVPIVEDDPYGLLCFDAGGFLPPLRALDGDWVLYTGSFSKILAPGLRLGWLVIPPQLVSRFTIVKEAADLECSALTQRAVARYLASGALPAHLALLRATYRERRDALLASLERHFTKGATWTEPRGGMFVWVDLDSSVDALALLRRAIDELGVAFVPGVAFATPVRGVATSAGAHSMRLSFATLQPAQIEDAVARLAALAGG